MIVIVAILLIFGVVVRHKWRNAAAKKEEILRLVAMASEEEAEIAKLQAVDGYSYTPPPPPPPPSPPPPPLEKRCYCAVCYRPTTTRCSQCKAVRYCSGKCQIIHWRQGHKDDCRPATSLHATKESKRVLEIHLDNHVGIPFNNEVEIRSDRAPEVDDSGSSSSSLPCISTSTERSETSFDASVSEDLESETVSSPDKVASEGIKSHMLQTISDPDKTDAPSLYPLNSTVYTVNKTLKANKINKKLATKTDENFQSTSFKDKVSRNGAAVLQEFVLDATELRSPQSSSSLQAVSSVENGENQEHQSSGKVMKSIYSRGSGNPNQVSSVELRNSQCSKSLSTSSSNEYWKNEAQLCTAKETRSMSFRSSLNDQNMYTEAGSLHSEIKDVRMLAQPTSKGLKTSVRKFVQHFRVPKQPKSFTFDMGKDSAGTYNHKIVFPPKLFMQLYSCDGMKLHPFGLVNCGNSCYANAVLQCLIFTRPLTSYLLQRLHSKTCRKRDWCLICEFERLIQKGQEMNSPFSPVGILSQIQKIGSHLSHGREEDAHDFLRNVVDRMQSIWLEEAGVSGQWVEDSTLLGLTFGGYLRSKIKCMKCSVRSEQCDRMMDLTVEINGDINTLEEALTQFTVSETLGGDDKYKCSRCKSYQKAKKKLTILDAPNILTIVLKRFRSGNLEKLNKLVQFPEILNLAPYMSGMSDKYPIYDLYAVVVHLNAMNAAYTGHYICYVKDFRREWFRIDDSRVTHVDLETVLSAEAYILFYARRTLRLPSLVTNSNVYSDGKTTRTMEAISTSISAKKKNSKSRSSDSDWYRDSKMVHQRSERHSYQLPPNDYTGNNILGPDNWHFHSNHRNSMVDSSSDCSSIFSASDAGSYSTDSTKDSSAEDISGYIFGSSLYHR
ncbi:ubiquitin carboxyl-terminal hydrolase 19 [Sesamum indicum]|uniref:ubiquitinyl hydrolase 1 n=1 Tax=Sesamum indicum TaxID=4182 RepID=A0A6I9UGB0_SESIN|nr:ubiquitin carboxyl-terminal hydrolase 19 [Sesamum indicum]